MKTNTYSFQLADNQGWNIAFTEKMRNFFSPIPDLASFSTFLRENTRRIIFSEKNYEDGDENPLEGIPDKLREGMPKDGWRKNTYHFCDYWDHPEREDILCFLDIDSAEVTKCSPDSLRFLKGFFLFNPLMLGIQRKKGLHLHGALVEYNGKGAIIAAPGGTGKSTTCTRLPKTWKVLCDDNALVVRGKDGRFYAHPLPTWSYYMENDRLRPVDMQAPIPLHGLFFLEQADCNSLLPMRSDCAAANLFSSAIQISRGEWKILNEETLSAFRHMAVSRSMEVSGEIPSYRFRLSLTGDFWKMLEEALETY